VENLPELFYDADGDVLYLSIGKPQHAISQELGDDVLLRVDPETGEALALRDYEQTNITRKTAVVVYLDQPDGFLITVFFTSKPGKIEQKGKLIWSPSQKNS
jgi:uncharacterized protein YuzE